MVEYPAAAQTSDRNHGLDFLRGSAALGIAVAHFLSWRMALPVESLGLFGVYTFFVLSGLSMMMVYGRAFSEQIDKSSLFAFYNHRLARIMPLLALVSLLTFAKVAIWHEASANELAKFFLTATGAFALQSAGFLSNTIGAWSLGIEGFFYLVFPAVALLTMNVGTRALGMAIILLVAAQQAFLFLLRDKIGSEEHWNLYIGPLTFAPFFMAGVYIFRQETLQRKIRLIWAVLGLGIEICFSLIFDIELKSNAFCYLILSLVSAASVWCAYKSKINSRMIWLCAFLGDVSYALYLTHWIAFVLVLRLSRFYAFPIWLEGVAFIFVAVSGAYLTFVFFERPLRNFIRRHA